MGDWRNVNARREKYDAWKRRAESNRPISGLHFRLSHQALPAVLQHDRTSLFNCIRRHSYLDLLPSSLHFFLLHHLLFATPTMAASRSVATFARARPSAIPFSSIRPVQTLQSSSPCAAFSTTSLRKATPMGPPPQGFRLPREKRWDEGKETSIDKASTYFLMTEMMRGMYVVLEQFFRPP